MGGGVKSVYTVYKDKPGISCLIGTPDNCIKNRTGTEPANRLASSRINKFILRVFFERRHKGIGNCHGYIEISQFPLATLGLYKIEYVRVLNPQDSHIGAPPGTTLFYHLGSGIIYLHEGDRTAGNPSGSPDDIRPWSESGEGEPCSTPALQDKRGVFQCIKDTLHRVIDRQDKTGSKLPDLFAGIHQGR